MKTYTEKLHELENIRSLVVFKHIIKTFSHLVSTVLNLKLLSVDLILNVVNLLVQLCDIHLSILKSSKKIIQIVFILDSDLVW